MRAPGAALGVAPVAARAAARRRRRRIERSVLMYGRAPLPRTVRQRSVPACRSRSPGRACVRAPRALRDRAPQLRQSIAYRRRAPPSTKLGAPRLKQPPRMAAWCARALVSLDELRNEALVQPIHEHTVRARLPRELLRRLDVRHVRDECGGKRVEAEAREAQVRHELDLILAIAGERLRIDGRARHCGHAHTNP